MNSWWLSLLFALISCFILGVYSIDCVKDNECHYGRCCGGHCVWHHFCSCVNDNDCRAGEKCNYVHHGFRYCKTDTSATSTPKESETNRREENPWRTGGTIIVISCLAATIGLGVVIYLVCKVKKSRKRPTNVNLLPHHATQTGMTRMNPLATADVQMQQESAACNGATAMEAEAGPCPFKAPGALPSYYELPLEGGVKGKDDPPPGYDEAVKPSDGVTTK